MIRSTLRVLAAVLTICVAAHVAAQTEMRLDVERQSLTGTHRHYAQFIRGIRVFGGERSETLLPDGLLRVNFDRRAVEPPSRGASASSVAARRFAGGEFVYLNVDGEARPAWKRVETPRPLEPHARFYDAATGALLRDVPLFFTATGRVFDVNPVAKLNAPWLRDQNGSASAVPDAAYSEVELPGLAPAGTLTGPNTQIVDVQEPFTPHADASQPLFFNRSQPQFAEVNAYFQIDRAQRYLQSLGYTGARRLVAYSLPVDPHAANGTDNSYYLEGTFVGRGTLYFGDGGTPDAEDSDIMLHEFMHAVHDWIIPGGLNGTSSSQARAISEGTADYWSFSSTYALTIVSGRDPYCIGDWDARCGGDDPLRQCGYPVGADCLRRVDSTKTIADYINSETPGTEHKNGEMWSSAIREIFMTLGRRYGAAEGKRITDTVVIESFFGLPPNPGFATVAQAMLAADRLLRGGAEADVICAAMTARGLLSDCGNVPRGEWTLVQSPAQGLPIPDGTGSVTSKLSVADTRLIDKLAVHVDIAHPSRGDLIITLAAPDGTTVKLKESSPIDRTRDVHATFGIDAAAAESLDVFHGKPAAGTWTLTVSDIYAGDAGALQSWDLRIAFAGDERLTLRPAAAADRIIVPIAGHALGVGGSSFTSDVFVLNRGSRAAAVMLLFTPTGANGTTTFAATKSTIAAGQTAAFRDIVASVFAMSGTGTVDISGDTASLLVTSTAVNATAAGELTQSVDAVSPRAAIGAADAPLELFPIRPMDTWRCNIGVVETAGVSGSARIVVRTISGETVMLVDVPVAPFSHRWIPLTMPAVLPGQFASVTVSSGAARVIAYASMVENASGDAMTIIGRQASANATLAIVPVVARTPGIGGSEWRSELTWANVTLAEDHVSDVPALQGTFFPSSGSTPGQTVHGGLSGYVGDVLYVDFWRRDTATGFLQMLIPPKTFVVTRTSTNQGSARGGSVGQRIEPVNISNAIGAGAAVDALGIEQFSGKRTNFGITEVTGAPADVRISLIAASGDVLARTVVSLGPHRHAQFPLAALRGDSVRNARLRFEVIGGDGRILAYASVVDQTTSDPFFVLAR